MDAEAHVSRACRFRHPFSRPRKDDTINPAPRSLSLLALLGAGVLLFAGCASGTAVAGTMDMAPRATLVSVAGLGVDDDGTTLTLSGGDAQFATPVEVSVIGG
ncbi:hypothetical protein [Microbacterium lacticum]